MPKDYYGLMKNDKPSHMLHLTICQVSLKSPHTKESENIHAVIMKLVETDI